MFDVDKLIENVHGNPPLWDKSISDYSDRNVREKCWMLIGQDMFPDWNDVPLKERDKREKDMKNKWRHVRDNFFRILNQGKSGDAAPLKKRKKEYVYAESLSFLLNSATKRPTTGNLGAADSEEIPENIETLDGTEFEQESAQEDGVARPFRKHSNDNDVTRKQSKLTPFQTQILQKLDSGTAAEQDVDRLFLLSMLPDYKKLNDDEKLDFKLMTLQFFRNARQKKQLQHPFSATIPFSQNISNHPNIHQFYMPQSSHYFQAPRFSEPDFLPEWRDTVQQQQLGGQVRQKTHQNVQMTAEETHSITELQSPQSTYTSPTESMFSQYSGSNSNNEN